MATDADVNDMLTYTLWWGKSSVNLNKTNIIASAKQGISVTLTQTGLINDTKYYFKVVVNDGIDETPSNEGNERTYCKGEYCSGGYYTYPTCTNCNGTEKTQCNQCDSDGLIGPTTYTTCPSCNAHGVICLHSNARWQSGDKWGTPRTCPVCGRSLGV